MSNFLQKCNFMVNISCGIEILILLMGYGIRRIKGREEKTTPCIRKKHNTAQERDTRKSAV